MKKTQIFLSLVMAVCIILSGFSLPACAEESDLGYLMDFENLSAGPVGNGLGVFDADFGMCESRNIISENGNLAVEVVKILSSSPTGAWVQHTFDDDDVIQGGMCIEFSVKQTVDRSKNVNFYNNTSGTQFLSFVFGKNGTGSINGTTVSLPNNLDGEYHHYKFQINDSGSIMFWYDNTLVDGNFTVKSTALLKRYRFNLGGTETEGENNSFIIDNICAYPLTNPIPSMPFSGSKAGEYEYNSEIVLTAENDCTIYYTTDGTYPAFTNDCKYTGPLKLDSVNLMIRAVAVRDDGKYSACAFFGPFNPINENGLVLLTKSPFDHTDPAKITGANLEIMCMKESMEINLILCLYEGEKLIKDAIEICPYMLSYGLNTIDITIAANEKADSAVLYLWNKNDASFAPLTQYWQTGNIQ